MKCPRCERYTHIKDIWIAANLSTRRLRYCPSCKIWFRTSEITREKRIGDIVNISAMVKKHTKRL